MEGMIFLVVVVLLYFAPSIVATIRKTTIKGDVYLMNLLAGWTGIGWIISMIMALWKTQKKAY